MPRPMTRRGFLQFCGVGAAGAFLAACVPAPQVTEKEVTKIVEGTPQIVKETVVVEKEVKQQAQLSFACYSYVVGDQWMKALAEAFMKEQPDIKLDTTLIGWDDYWTKIEVGIAAGTAPDVFVHDWGRVPRYAFRGITLMLDPLIQRDNFPVDNIFPVCFNAYQWEPGTIATGKGAIWAIPYDSYSLAMFINTSASEAAGLKMPNKGWTWDDFTTYAKAMTVDKNADGQPEQYGTYVDLGMEIVGRSWPIWQAGADWTNADMTQATCDTPEFLEAVHWVTDQVTVHKTAPLPGPQQVDPFQAGLAAMSFTGLWNLSTFATEIKDFQWDITYAPCSPKTGKCTVIADIDAWAISASSTQREAAWTLVKWVAGPEGQQMGVDLNVCPPSNKEILAKWVAMTPPSNRAVVPEMLGDARPAWNFFGVSEWNNEYATPILESVLQGQRTVEEAAPLLKESLQAALDDAWALVKST